MLSTSSPTLPVTQTAASVTHSVTPRMTNSPAAGRDAADALPYGVADVADDREIAWVRDDPDARRGRLGVSGPDQDERARAASASAALSRADVTSWLTARHG